MSIRTYVRLFGSVSVCMHTSSYWIWGKTADAVITTTLAGVTDAIAVVVAVTVVIWHDRVC